MSMIDISQKKEVRREATAQGVIHLKPSTIEQIRSNTIRKGDPLKVAEAAAMLAVKQTPLLLPHCHPIPIHSIEFASEVGADQVRITLTVVSVGRTGVEMEALVGLGIALNTIWDMVKYLEKDDKGEYPDTQITDIRVTKKSKEE